MLLIWGFKMYLKRVKSTSTSPRRLTRSLCKLLWFFSLYNRWLKGPPCGRPRLRPMSLQIGHQAGYTRILPTLRQVFLKTMHMMLNELLLLEYLGIMSCPAPRCLRSNDVQFLGLMQLRLCDSVPLRQKQNGPTFLGIIIGYHFAILISTSFEETSNGKSSIKANGRPAPERRLYSAMLSSFLVPIS